MPEETTDNIAHMFDAEKCPRCGEPDPIKGWGLCGGGFGSYMLCNNSACDWFVKHLDVEQPEAEDG